MLALEGSILADRLQEIRKALFGKKRTETCERVVIMKRNLLLGAAAAALMSAPAMAGERFEAGFLSGELSANVTMTSDYVFRGVSQTDEGPAIQGGFDYVMDTGLYFGTWASNVDFANSAEFDFYGGFSQTLYLNECFDKGALAARGCGLPTFTYDVGVIYYAYPGSYDQQVELDMTEIYGKLGVDFGWVALETGLYYSPDFTGTAGEVEGYYYYGSAAVPLEDAIGLPVSLDGRLGYQDVDGFDGYTEWEVGLNVTAFTLDWRVAYTDTDIDANDNFFGAVEEEGDGRVYFSVGKTF